MKQKLIITQYTDPICIWCYALEPALRKIEFILQDQVKFNSVLGLLVADSKEIIGEGVAAKIRFTQLKTEMKKHFQEAADRSGIPVSVKHMDMIRPEDITSLPASKAVAAMKLLDEYQANRYLRRIREAFHSDDLNTSEEKVLKELAKEFPVDQEKFRQYLESKTAQKELEKELEICRQAGVRAFPTLKLEYGEKVRTLHGYVEYEALKKIIEELTDGELQSAFSLSKEMTDTVVEELLASKEFEKQERGDSYFLKVKKAAIGSCDPVSGICNL